MTTVTVRPHTRNRPAKPADPLQALIDACLAAKRSAGTRRPANAPYASPKACYDGARDIGAVRAQYNPEAC